MRSISLTLAFALMTAAGHVGASQVVVDFETLALGTDTITMSSYQADGFSLTSDIDPVMQADAFAAWGTASDNYARSVALFNQYAESQTTLAPLIAGRTFSLLAIDLAPAFGDAAVGATVQFHAVQADGTHVTGDCSFTSVLTFSTCSLPKTFVKLVSVTWLQGDIQHQFDNLVLATAVPEPAEAVMLLAGLALLANRKRRPQ
jgi:hypothetical protein